MMESMRNAAKNWVAKVLLGLLALSFGVWGIADVFRGFDAGALATVGEEEITAQQYSNALTRSLQQFADQTGTPLSVEDARALGIDRNVLNQLIQTAAIDNQIKTLNLGMADKVIVDEVAANAAFKGADGKFNNDTFQRWLQQSGMNEQMFLAAERRDRLRQAIGAAVNEDFTPPKALVDALYRFGSEQRDARYFVVQTADTEVAAPTDGEIKEQYDGNPQSYTAPEYRMIAVIAVEPADIAMKQVISTEELAAGYDKYKLDYSTPETRTVLQLTFPNEEEAKKAKERIDGGLDFLALAKERGVTEADATFADKQKTEFIDETVGEAAFSLAEGATSAPVKGAFAISLVKVVKIVPSAQETPEQVKDRLTERLQLEKAREEVQSVYDQIEDARAAQTAFEEIASRAGLSFLLAGPVDANGRGKDGKELLIPHGAEVLKAAFASDVGVENDAISLDDGFVWYEVREVVPSAVKPLAEVKDQVVQDITARKVRELSLAKATKLAERAKAGTSLDDLAKEISATVQTATGLKRNETSADFDNTAVAALFAVPQNAFTVALEGDGKGAKVIQSQAVLLPPFDGTSEEAKKLVEEASTTMGADVLSTYLDALQSTTGVTINETLWRQIAGTTQQ